MRLRYRKLSLSVSLALFLFLILPSFVYAGYYWEVEEVTKGKGVQGMSVGKETVKSYLSARGFREERYGMITILDLDKGIFYVLEPERKRYTKRDPATEEKPAHAEDLDEETLKMMQMMKMEVIETKETKCIEGYKCRKYMIKSGMFEIENWVSKDVPGYSEIRKIMRKLGRLQRNDPFMKEMDFAQIYEKMDGFVVQSVMKGMGGTTTATLKKIEKRALSDALFAVPPGYVEEEQAGQAPGPRAIPEDMPAELKKMLQEMEKN
jgi:hypothetical protein